MEFIGIDSPEKLATFAGIALLVVFFGLKYMDRVLTFVLGGSSAKLEAIEKHVIGLTLSADKVDKIEEQVSSLGEGLVAIKEIHDSMLLMSREIDDISFAVNHKERMGEGTPTLLESSLEIRSKCCTMESDVNQIKEVVLGLAQWRQQYIGGPLDTGKKVQEFVAGMQQFRVDTIAALMDVKLDIDKKMCPAWEKNMGVEQVQCKKDEPEQRNDES